MKVLRLGIKDIQLPDRLNKTSVELKVRIKYAYTRVYPKRLNKTSVELKESVVIDPYPEARARVSIRLV